MTEKEKTFYKLALIRKAEEAIIKEYPTNDIKTPCHLAIGAEAIAVAVTNKFPTAKIFASYRNHHWYLASNGNLQNFFLELYGKENEIADGKAGSMHLSSPETGLMLTSAVVATQIGPALGHALAKNYTGDKTPTIVVLGDGATEEGVFYESLNLAALWKLPVLFVVEDNDLAIHQVKQNRQSYDLGRLVSAYNIPYFSSHSCSVNGLTQVLDLITKLPAVVHFSYHRFYEHVGPGKDYNAGYRQEPEASYYFDPLYWARMSEDLAEQRKKQIERLVDLEIQTAIETAQKASPPSPQKLLEHIWA